LACTFQGSGAKGTAILASSPIHKNDRQILEWAVIRYPRGSRSMRERGTRRSLAPSTNTQCPSLMPSSFSRCIRTSRSTGAQPTKARELFADAVAEDFNAKFGTDVNNIDHWHALCHVLRIDPIPRNISASRKVRALVSWVRHSELSYSCFCTGCQLAIKANQPR